VEADRGSGGSRPRACRAVRRYEPQAFAGTATC